MVVVDYPAAYKNPLISPESFRGKGGNSANEYKIIGM